MNGGMIATGTAATSEGFGIDITSGGKVYVPYMFTVGDVYAYDPAFSYSNNVLFGEFLSGTALGYVNGSLFGTNNSTANTIPGPIQLGFRNDGNYATGKISEIIYVNAALSVTQRQQLEGYLAWKWGLETNLPANHPYRNSAPGLTPNILLNATFITGEGLQLSLTGIPNDPYILQSTTNLSAPASWQPVATNAADTNGNWQFTDTNSLTLPTRFYRVTMPTD
jgi:hypothetical protein